ncbi:hypothetical protein EOM81_09515 [bacterium]|nr:hypothetical protein [bacterium]
MIIPDKEISDKVAAKLSENQRWNKDTVSKIANFVKDGNVTTADLVFLLENQRPEKAEVGK